MEKEINADVFREQKTGQQKAISSKEGKERKEIGY